MRSEDLDQFAESHRMIEEYLQYIQSTVFTIYTVDSCYLDFGCFELPLISKRKSDPSFKVEILHQVIILLIRGEIAPKEQFLPFSTISEYISNLRSQITYLFGKFSCLICIFP